jgi:spore photoproduct lyase
MASFVQRVGDGLIVKRFDRTPLPLMDSDVVCPHFLELKWANGCPFDCAWCYLKGTFRFQAGGKKPVVKEYQKIESHVRVFFKEATSPEILNTGELADSLMWEGSNEPFLNLLSPCLKNKTCTKCCS